jgi:hypothetical protein
MQRASHLRIAGTKLVPDTLCCAARPEVINQMNVRAAAPMVVAIRKISLVKIEKVPLGQIRSEKYVP